MNHNFRPLIPINQNGLDDVADALLNSPAVEEGNEGKPPVITTANINKSEYIQVPEFNLLIAKEEPNWTKKYIWQEALVKVQEQGLKMPSPKVMMQHFMNVKEASEGRRVLFDGNGNDLTVDESCYLWNYISSTDRAKFGKSCWTWLDAYFIEENGKWYMETDHKISFDANGKVLRNKDNIPIFTKQRFDLDSCLRKDAYVDLGFNSQGLAVSESQNQNYSQGNNIHFCHPRNGSVAGFGADSGRTVLYCLGGPSYSDASLGVLTCAEGAQKILGEAK